MKRTLESGDQILLIVILQHEYAITLTTWTHPNHNVARRSRQLGRALANYDLGRLSEVRGKHQSLRGRETAVHDSLQDIGRGMTRRPTGHDEHSRCQRAQKLFALFT